MSANIPPNPYFSGINFNPTFFNVIQAYLTEVIANTKYLLLSGANFMTGNLGIKRVAAVELDINGKAYINNFIYGTPAIGDYGGTSTRLILKAGSGTETPMALGVNSNDLWYGTHTIGNHIFYTGITARMRILANGNVGIGTTTLIGNILQVGDGGRLRISNSSNDSTSIGTRDVDNFENTRIYLFANQHPTNPGIIEYISTSTGVHKFITGGVNEKMRISTDGNVGIGTNNPLYRCHIKGATPATLRIETDTNDINQVSQIAFGIPAFTAAGCPKISSTTDNGNVGNLQFSTTTNGVGASTVRMTILANGNIGIGNNNPNNILQVGDGGKLRISNGITDYTLLGSKDGDDVNNTRIVVSGYQRPALNGVIEYISTTTIGYHSFKINNEEKIRIDPDDFQISTSCTTYGFNYYTDGEYAVHTPKTNTSGTVLSGYFIYCGYFYSSLVNVIVSHTSISYTYWAGHFITNNTTQPISINVLNSSSMTFTAFQEQGTLDWWILCVPTVSYNIADKLRMKFYG